MSLRSPRERALQTIAYEVGGLILAIPLYLVYTGGGTGEGALVMAALSVAVLIWSPLHNTAWDWLEWRRVRRLASDRPQRWRALHAVSHEATTVAVTLPILVWLGGHGWLEALVLDLALTLLYAGYAYVFHNVYDRLRPVAPAPVAGEGWA